MIMCVLLCYPVSIRIYYQQGGLFLVCFLGTKNTMKSSRQSSVHNEYCASADMRRQGVTSCDNNISLKNSSQLMWFAPENQISTCEDKVSI